MTVYVVRVRVEGNVRVEADSPEEAERIAAEADVDVSGKPMFGEERETETLEEMRRTPLQPDDVRQEISVGEAG